MKKAMLVYSSFVTRVIVDENASDDEIIQATKAKLVNQVTNELGDNVESIGYDFEVPYNPEKD
jgi:hypothetical protein